MTAARTGVLLLAAAVAGWASAAAEAAQVAKTVLDVGRAGENLLAPDAWQPWQPWRRGFTREGEVLVCDNGTDSAAQRGARLFDVTLSDRTGKDRAVTLVYSVPVPGRRLRWLSDPRRSMRAEPGREYMNTARFHAGANGRLSRYPFGAVAEARRLADQQGDAQAMALRTSGFHDEQGRIPARLLDTPWCNGAVWSMNSMPGIVGEVTDFANKWSPAIRQRFYGPKRSGDLDGEYVDSSEGYVTDDLDFRRDHFATADTPLVFSPYSHRPAIFRGLVAFEYVRAIADDVHGMGKLMMANGTPTRLCWLAPMLDVLGTETNWHRQGRWQPMSDPELLYRRAMCAGKPFCFLMNTRFEEFSHELVERYMKRCLAYGMFPGFFSPNASQGHYFTRPELYNRDRPLFKKYVPLCKRLAEAGWEPITLARSGDEHVYVERFGTRYLTVFNDSRQKRTATITREGPSPASSRELLSGRAVLWRDARTTVTLEPEDVAVIALE